MSSDPKNYAVAVRHPDRKHFMLLGARGVLVNLRIHAVQFTAEDAVRMAGEIIRDNPGYEAKAKKLWK